MKNPNNNSVNYCKSLFLDERDEMAGPLNPDDTVKSRLKSLYQFLLGELKVQIVQYF